MGLGMNLFNAALGAFGVGTAKAKRGKDPALLELPPETREHEFIYADAPVWEEEPEPLEFIPREDVPEEEDELGRVPPFPRFKLDPEALKRADRRDVFGEYLDRYPAEDLEAFLKQWKVPLVLTAAVAAYLILR